MKPSKGLRIALYIRVSTEEQAENPEGSIRNQEERLRMAIQLKNMEGNFGEIKAVFIDRAKSGKNTNRPELQKMLLSIRKRELDLVMVAELSRISRSIKDFSQIWELMQQHACGFLSLRENFDTTTAAGEMVLFTVANIAQFERRQISERVSASFNARAQRGLFNGGSIPLGYKRIEGKSGYLQIDEEMAPAVRAAFKAFLNERALAQTAKWLNENNFRIKREREGGGNRSRMGFFTVGNLKQMLKNRFYLGIKTYEQKGETKETEAVWPAIIDPEVFEKVNTLLGENHRRLKTAMKDRYPYQFVGLVSCKTCGDRMVGKSAHGRTEKFGYYEHSWATVKGSYVPGLKCQCAPYRVLAKKLEPVGWAEIMKLLTQKEVAEELLASARRAHQINPASREVEKCNQTVFTVDRQLEVLAERLASLPQTISPTPVYRQMEKLEFQKKAALAKLTELNETGVVRDEPSDLKSFEKFAGALREMLASNDDSKVKAQIVRALIRKILITPDGAEFYFKVGETHVKSLTHQFTKSAVDFSSGRDQKKNGSHSIGSQADAEQNLRLVGSNTCLSGTRDRT